jgi:phosphoglycolate phosphatase-like HAD superfamily hydrolase
MKDLYHKEVSLESIDYRGRTDAYIARMMLQHYELEVTPQGLQKFMEGYLHHLEIELHKGQGGTHPGILEILETARNRQDLAQGLLTGNLVRGAKLKLSHFNVWHFFEFGAFADDSHIRNDLGPYAVRRATEKHGVEFSPEAVFVIGDTPHDIECGKVIGAQTIAVATGAFTVEQLQTHSPTHLFRDFSDTAAFFRAIDQAPPSR